MIPVYLFFTEEQNPQFVLYWIFALFSLESVQGTLDEVTIAVQNKQVFELEWGVFQDTLPIHLCLLFELHTLSHVLSGVCSGESDSAGL